tara:strand:- start:92 stop:457 length:366 start_codon:yes stop_codon:yes gene_type:complete
MHPTDGIIVPPDTVTTFLMTGGSSQQNADWLSSGSTAAANAGTAGVHIVCITPMTTAGAALIASVNLLQAAATPASGTSIASTGVNHLINGPTYFQVPGGSTGFGFFTYSSGFVQMQQWRK